MIDSRPSSPAQHPKLRQLWKEAFGDEDAYLDIFFRTAYSPKRSRVLLQDSEIMAAAYWLDCSFEDKKLAYIYAVAVAPARQGMGLGTMLMEQIHRQLTLDGYAGAVLVPGNEGLFQYYRRFGYETVSHHSEFTAEKTSPVLLTKIDTERFSRLRRQYLPRNGIIQEGENLALLDALAEFYEGENFIAAVSRNGQSCLELLGSLEAAGGIAASLELPRCSFRSPGEGSPYAMEKTLTGTPLPHGLYFGFGFD